MALNWVPELRTNTEWPKKMQSGPKKCIHSLLINIFGLNLNEISISGESVIQSKIQGHLSYHIACV
jgi:hypothetical protein